MQPCIDVPQLYLVGGAPILWAFSLGKHCPCQFIATIKSNSKKSIHQIYTELPEAKRVYYLNYSQSQFSLTIERVDSRVHFSDSQGLESVEYLNHDEFNLASCCF